VAKVILKLLENESAIKREQGHQQGYLGIAIENRWSGCSEYEKRAY